MKHKIFYTPTFIYFFSFSAIILFYLIEWSNLYPELHGELLTFLIITTIISGLLSLIQKRKLADPENTIELRPSFIKNGLYFIFFGTILDFAYERAVPLINTFVDPSYSYGDFDGVPTLHVLLATFNIFFSILLFDYYFKKKTRKSFFLFLISLFPFVLMLNRGAFMVVFCALIFIFLMRSPKLNFKKVLKTIGVLVAVLYLFGVVGNIRQPQTKDEKEYLLRVGGATDSFINSPVPGEFYWSYIYIISPVGNLQNIISSKADNFNENNLGIYICAQLFPDFISNRLIAVFNYQQPLTFDNDKAENYLVTPLLNAPTTYYMSYFFLGFGGMVIMYICLTLASLVYPILIKANNVYYTAGIAALNSIILLSTFNNMWFNIGTVLLWPFILSFFNRLNKS